MMEEILRRGFALAHRRIGLVFLDVLWKMMWLVATVAGLVLIAAWFTSDLGAIQWQKTGVRGVDAGIAVTVLRKFWAENRAAIFGVLVVFVVISVAGWFVMEAFFRQKLVRANHPAVGAVCDRPGAPRAPLQSSSFNVFLVSNMLKSAVLTTAGIMLAGVCLEGATTLAVVIFLSLTFFLVVIDTLIRSDAIGLLGTDLFRVSALIGILVSFEMMIGGAVAVMLVAAFLSVSRVTETVMMLGLAAVAVVFLNILHSYLLLVRFSAVGIMRQNVVEV
jgi:hypothetical protein